MKQMLREFLNDVEKLKGNDFQFRRVSVDQDDRVTFGVFNEYVHLKNYQLIEPDATLVRTVDYNRLMSSVTGECYRTASSGSSPVYSTFEQRIVRFKTRITSYAF